MKQPLKKGDFMKVFQEKKRILFALFTLFTSSISVSAPRLTIIFVADQFAYHYIPRLDPFLRGGIRELIDYGVFYQNAHYPHAMPATATGHAALNTGCFAKDHGFIGNKWFDQSGKKIRCTDDPSPSAAIFAKDGSLKKGTGASAKNLVVEGVSDQCALQARPGGNNKVFSFSYKDRAAIATAGDLGKAVWFDPTQGYFTTSKAYFEKFPTWLAKFNKEKKLDQPRTIKWELHYPEKKGAYDARNAKDYSVTTFKKPLIGTNISIPNPKDKEEPYEFFAFLPESNQVLLDLALTCIDKNLSQNKNDRLVIWICFSATDKLGHRYGPNCMEMFDLIYQLDAQMKKFMKKAETRVKKRDILYAFTADHGIAPIPELAYKEGIKSARRIDEKDLVKRANALIAKKHNINGLIHKYKTPQFYFNQKTFASLGKKKQTQVVNDLKTFFRNEPGIKNVWTTEELRASIFAPTDIELLYKNQIFPGRSGQLAIQVLPFCHTTKYPAGTAHRTPYEHNTHVPVIFYQKGVLEEKKIAKRVSMLQFANSLAQALDVPNAPASTFDVLPELFTQ
ncbi:alkaline phosphatase family protein [Candidatus Dependentiae bacterium]